MIRFLTFIFILFVLCQPTMAQKFNEKEEVRGEGARGRFTQEQAETVALSILPGEVVARDFERENSHVYHEFSILVSDGSIYELEINAVTGKLFEIEVENFAPGARPPAVLVDLMVPAASAAALARSEVFEETRGRGRVKLLDNVLTIANRKFKHSVRVRKSGRIYLVLIDALSGKVESVKRERSRL